MRTIQTCKISGHRVVEDDYGNRMTNVHSVFKCYGQYCAIDNPSKHPLSASPQLWRADRGILERICSHGVGHPDPDGRYGDRTHGCDGCCEPENLNTGAKTGASSAEKQQDSSPSHSRSTYRMKTRCLNCGRIGHVDIPLGTPSPAVASDDKCLYCEVTGKMVVCYPETR